MYKVMQSPQYVKYKPLFLQTGCVLQQSSSSSLPPTSLLTFYIINKHLTLSPRVNMKVGSSSLKTQDVLVGLTTRLLITYVLILRQGVGSEDSTTCHRWKKKRPRHINYMYIKHVI